jgi:hypothetical protein
MTEQAATADTPQAPPGDAPRDGDPRVPILEERVRRLEELVAALQDTQALEERVAERVAARAAPAPDNGVRAKAGLLFEAGRHLLPAAVGALAEPAAAPAPAAAQPAAPAPRPAWLLFDVYAEARAIARMYLDPRFRLTWQARLLPPALLAAIATSWVWLPGTSILPSIISTLIMKVVDLLLAFALFKVLHREVSRYRNTSPDLPPSLRL